MPKPKGREGVVYSTNTEFQFNDWFPVELQQIPFSQQKLKVSLDKNGRGGKVVTLIEGFQGPVSELEHLAKEIKNYCGTGGSAKDGQILIQGDVRKKASDFLEKKGVAVKVV